MYMTNRGIRKNTVGYARDYHLGHCLYHSLTDDKKYRNICMCINIYKNIEIYVYKNIEI